MIGIRSSSKDGLCSLPPAADRGCVVYCYNEFMHVRGNAQRIYTTAQGQHRGEMLL